MYPLAPVAVLTARCLEENGGMDGKPGPSLVKLLNPERQGIGTLERNLAEHEIVSNRQPCLALESPITRPLLL